MDTKKLILFMIISCMTIPVVAQEENVFIREGNRHYKSNKFTEAEIAYRKGLLKNSNSMEATYNLGNALFKQEKYAEALEQYQKIVPSDKIPKEKLAAVLHNTGNALLMQQKVAQSIEAYKNSLKLNPKDDETRYNLALAQYLLRNQENNKDQNKKEEEKQQPEEDKKEKQNKPDESKPQEQNQPRDMSKDKAEQILQALMQDEDDVMEKAKKLPKSPRRTVEKDW